MKKIKEVWFRINNKRKLNPLFTPDHYKSLLLQWKERYGFINFHDKGPGIILRHDIDADLGKAVRMAEIEAGRDANINRAMFCHGNTPLAKSTYFVLNTARYWKSKEMIPSLRYIQRLGHEIGWKNNAAVECAMTGKKLELCIREPLEYLRSHGITIRGTAAHGDKLCYKLGLMNYNIFCFPSPGWDFWGNLRTFTLEEFGLEYEAYHVPYDDYLIDCHSGQEEAGIKHWESGGRYQIVIYPQNWKI